MPDNVYEFHYSGQDVASAQRTRFIGSSQFKIILLLWLGTVIYLALPIFWPGKIPGMSESSWALVWQVSLAYLVTLAVLIFITPWMDFLFRRFWHVKLELRFNEKMMRVNVAGKPGGLQLQWGQLRRVQENKRVFVIEYDTSSKYLILPKSAFSKPGSEKRFQALLARRNMIPLMPETSANDTDEVGDEGAANANRAEGANKKTERKTKHRKQTAKR